MEKTKKILLAVGGMSCGGCAANVLRILATRPGVAAAEVDLPAGMAAVTYRPVETGPEKLAAAVSAAGYSAVVTDPAAHC